MFILTFKYCGENHPRLAVSNLNYKAIIEHSETFISDIQFYTYQSVQANFSLQVYYGAKKKEVTRTNFAAEQ